MQEIYENVMKNIVEKICIYKSIKDDCLIDIIEKIE